MNTPNKQTNLRGRQAELLYYLLTLTGFLVLLELSFFLQCNRAYLSDYQFMTQHLQLPWAMLPGVVFFIFAQALVHAGFAVLIWLLSIGLASASNRAADKFITLGITLWCVGMFFVVAANQAYFPNSKFAELSGIFLSARPY